MINILYSLLIMITISNGFRLSPTWYNIKNKGRSKLSKEKSISMSSEDDEPNWRRPLIAPQETNAIRFSRKANPKESMGRALEFNWRSGLCKHAVTFEGTEIIRRLHFCGDLLSFGMVDGRVCLIRISTGEILDKFSEHMCEVTSIDFDGTTLVSGSSDGETVVYALTYKGSGDFGMPIHCFQHHERKVTATKIVRSPTIKGVNGEDTTDFEKNKMIVSCSMDKKLVAVDSTTGELVYSRELPLSPLCMDISGNYGVLGFLDGSVMFFNVKSGQPILQFQAHADRVRSVHFQSDHSVITGSNKGVIKRWDLSGDESVVSENQKPESIKPTEDDEKPENDDINSTKNLPVSSKPSRIIDYYFQEIIDSQNKKSKSKFNAKKKTKSSIIEGKLNQAAVKVEGNNDLESSKNGSNIDKDSKQSELNYQPTDPSPKDQKVKAFYRESLKAPCPVVAVQGDDEKILAAFEDGTIVCWDAKTQGINFELQGRSNLISSLQFDAHRLVADGTGTVLVSHDFSDPPEEPEDLAYIG